MLIYVLVMLIPGAILGFLASRGILNDKALEEKQARQALVSTSLAFFDNLDSLLTSKITQPDLRQENSEHIVLTFKQKSGGEPEITQHNLLYYPAGYPLDHQQPEPSIDWEKGWMLEYQNQDYAAAFGFYQNILNTFTDDPTRVACLVAQARIYHKRNQPMLADSVWHSLALEYNHLSYQGLPVGALAFMQLAQEEDLLNELIHPKAEYYKAQFNLLKPEPTDQDSLVTILDYQESRTDQAIQLYNEADLLFSGANVNPNKRYYTFADMTLAFLSHTRLSGQRNALILDLLPFLEAKYEEFFLSDVGSEIPWMIEDIGGQILMGSQYDNKLNWLAFSFPDQLPPWTLKLALVQSSWLATMLQPGNGVFLLIFIFIILVMLFGLIFTLNILNQEFKLNKLKTEFISNVSHELKSPLTSIRQMTEMLYHQRVESDEQRKDYYGIMLDQSEHLSHLIDNILDFSRMEENRKQYKFEETWLFVQGLFVLIVYKDALAIHYQSY